MTRWSRQEGSALILMLGVAAVLAVFTATLIMAIANSQGATASTREQTQAFNVAEAGLDSALAVVAAATWPMTSGSSFDDTVNLSEAYEAAYPDEDTRPEMTVTSYDNLSPVDEYVQWDSNDDGIMWVDATATVDGKSARVRAQVSRETSSSPLTSLDAALYTDGNVSVGSGFVWAKTSPTGSAYVAADGTPLSNIYARGDVTRSSWSWPSPSTVGFKLGYTDEDGTAHPGTDRWTGHYPSVTTTHNDGVQPLDSVLPQSTVDSLVAQAQAASPPQANAGGHLVTTSEKNALQASSPQNYTATQDLVVNGDLTLRGGESWFNFRSLYVTGSLTLNGNTHTTTTALYVGGNFTVNGPGGTQSFGSTYVAGNVLWSGAASANCTNLYVGGTFTSSAGPFTHTLGPTYVAGNVSFSGNQAGIVAPLFVTGGNVTASGSAYLGSTETPTLLLVYNSSASRTVTWGSNGVFTGLIANMAGSVSISAGGNGSRNDIVGAIMAVGDISIPNNAGVLYIPDVLANLPITTSMTSTTAVPGTWQELPAN